MAGDWIKMRMDLRRDEAVVILCERLSIPDPDTIVGKLHRFWSWISEISRDGRLGDLSTGNINSVMELAGFAEALISVKWLKQAKSGLLSPNFDRHMSSSAKSRCGEAIRKARQRRTLQSEKCPDKFGTRAEAAESKEKTEIENAEHIAALKLQSAENTFGEKSEEAPPRVPDTRVFETLFEATHNGKPIFTRTAAISIARHKKATVRQVAWALQRFREMARDSELRSPGGLVRTLIEKESPDRSWIESYQRQEIASTLARSLTERAASGQSTQGVANVRAG